MAAGSRSQSVRAHGAHLIVSVSHADLPASHGKVRISRVYICSTSASCWQPCLHHWEQKGSAGRWGGGGGGLSVFCSMRMASHLDEDLPALGSLGTGHAGRDLGEGGGGGANKGGGVPNAVQGAHGAQAGMDVCQMGLLTTHCGMHQALRLPEPIQQACDAAHPGCTLLRLVL